MPRPSKQPWHHKDVFYGPGGYKNLYTWNIPLISGFYYLPATCDLWLLGPTLSNAYSRHGHAIKHTQLFVNNPIQQQCACIPEYSGCKACTGTQNLLFLIHLQKKRMKSNFFAIQLCLLIFRKEGFYENSKSAYFPLSLIVSNATTWHKKAPLHAFYGPKKGQNTPSPHSLHHNYKISGYF